MEWRELDDAPGRIRDELARRGLALKKRWGQNFMVSRAARERIVSALDPAAGDLVWEVGPGLGGITALLVEREARVTVFEIDHGLMRVIRDRFGDGVEVVAGDAVATLTQQEERPDRFVGNLPYRSAAAIVTTVLESPGLMESLHRLVITVQREMARRMVAGPGSSDYSPFSVLCALATRARLAGELSRGNFYPPPEVVSSVVVMEPRQIDPDLRRLASTAARSLFTSRRKTVANNAATLARRLGLPAARIKGLLAAAGISPGARAESIPPDGFLELARHLQRELE